MAGAESESRQVQFRFQQRLQDGEDGQSSASDDDRNAVEVSFNESNPYRRKSSIVKKDGDDDIPAHTHRRVGSVGKTECLVHQFLEGEKKHHLKQHHRGHAHRTASSRGDKDTDGDTPQRQVVLETKDISSEEGLDRPQDPKGIFVRAHESETGESGIENGDGQQDQAEWCTSMTKPGALPPPSISRTTSSELDKNGGINENNNSGGNLHSRLLTKKQLSEMAWGVRELSRRLGSIRLRFRVRTVFLLTKPQDHSLASKARDLTAWLLDTAARGTAYTVYVEPALRDIRDFDAEGLVDNVWRSDQGDRREAARRLRVWSEEMCRTRPQTFDFVITLGGDGTVLYASWLFQRIVPPVLSFALGSLGFLTKFDFENYKSTLTAAFKDGVSLSLRLRFEGTVMRSQRRKDAETQRDLVDELIGEEKDDERTHHPDGTFEVLNEIVVDRGPNPTMSETEIFGDDEHFTTVMADGVCVSTPTGSTAYNLAAGGSLCHPENPVMLLTAISPHTLSFRPVILPDTIVLRLGVPYSARTSSWASFDGRERIEVHPGDYVTISASRYPFASVQMDGRRSEDWVNSISAKLAWNSRSKQKPFKDSGS